MTLQMLLPERFQPRADQLFERWKQRIHAMAPDCRVEHVGASSIPGAISKGDLDICFIVPRDRFDAAIEQLRALGCEEKLDTLRTDELCMLIAPVDDFDVAIQVVAAGSRYEFFIAFRDALRADPLLVDQYNRLKVEAAPLGPQAYRHAKRVFIETVLASCP